MGLPRSAIGLALGLALLAGGSGHAQQILRCVDERGKTYYTEKPGPNCKPTRIDAEPGKPPAKAPAVKAPEKQPRPVAKSAPAPLTREAHCRGLSSEVARFDAGKSRLQPAAAAARRSAVDKEIAKSCG
jgi:hypothetical protein